MPRFDRRDFLNITAVAGCGIAAATLLGKEIFSANFTIEETRLLMGTLIHLKILSQNEEQGRMALNSTFGEMERLIKLFDHRNPQSELAVLNSKGYLAKSSTEMQEVLEAAINYSVITGGAFDVSVAPIVRAHRETQEISKQMLGLVSSHNIDVVGEKIRLLKNGMSLTLDGIAKGFIVDKAVAKLNSQGFDSVLVEAGGDLMALGKSSSHASWQVGIAHPRPEKMNGYLASFSLSNSAAATSGDYLNSFSSDNSLHHIVDPRTGFSPSELASVTTIAGSAMEADALSTAFMVAGVLASIDMLQEFENTEALFVTKNLDIYKSTGFPI